MFYGIKSQIYGDKKIVVSIPHITIFGFRAYNSLRILKSYGIQSSLVNAIDFIIQCSRTKHPYQGTIIELRFYKCFH